MNFRAAIFDLDGTLLDSMDVWENIEAAEYTIALFHLSESVDAIIREWNEMAAYEYAHNVALSPFTADYLRQLKHAGIKLAVATVLPQKLYEPCLKKNGIMLFQRISEYFRSDCDRLLSAGRQTAFSCPDAEAVWRQCKHDDASYSMSAKMGCRRPGGKKFLFLRI